MDYKNHRIHLLNMNICVYLYAHLWSSYGSEDMYDNSEERELKPSKNL
jgi:hypothetical protein